MGLHQNQLVICVERGILEAQSLLFAKSWARYLKPVWSCLAVSPRSGHEMSADTADQLRALGVDLLEADINTQFGHYPIANKVLAMAYLEQKHTPQNLVFADTDTVFLNPIDQLMISRPQGLYLRPVDNKGPGTLGSEDENEVFWQAVFDHFSLPLPAVGLRTTVGNQAIRDYYNAGFIWAQGLPGFYQQWQQDFLSLVNSGLRPAAYISRDGDDFRCLDQVSLAVTASRYQDAVEVLPESYNYPIPFRPRLQKHRPLPLDALVHVHYHKWFQHPGFLDHVTDHQDRLSQTYQWLRQQTPLEPLIDDDFKC
jgi:hypothetical protein